MQIKQLHCMHPSDILNFLRNIQPNVHTIEGLLTMIREENQRAELYGQQNIPELMEVSAYQWQLEQLEMKLKAPSLIKISFSSEPTDDKKVKTLEEEAEELLLAIVMRMISKGDLENKEDVERFKLIL
jgi:hypothetical protein